MEKTAIGTNDLGMHIVIRPISKDLLSKDEIVGMETGKINFVLGIISSCKKDPGSNSEVFSHAAI